MITNRPYNAVRYQPTACIVLNSPTTSPVIAKALRAMWGQGVDKNEPCGVKPGGPAMKLRRCDMLLEGVANAVLAERVGPAFHIYWPLARRDEGRAAWRQWLAQAPDKRN